MKDNFHPEYKDVVITCACGASINTRSTKQNIHVNICSGCHPFFTGKQKLVDSAGRVERFEKRYAKKKTVEKKKAVEIKKAEAPSEPEKPTAEIQGENPDS